MISTISYALAALLGLGVPTFVLGYSTTMVGYGVSFVSHVIGLGLFAATFKKLFSIEVDKSEDLD